MTGMIRARYVRQHLAAMTRRTCGTLLLLATCAATLGAQTADSVPTTIAIRVVRSPRWQGDTALRVVSAFVEQVVVRRGKDSVVSSTRTSETGDAVLRPVPALGGRIRIRALGLLPQQIPLIFDTVSGPRIIHLADQPVTLGQICVHAWGPGVVLRFPAHHAKKPVQLRVRVWSESPYERYADTTHQILPGADTAFSTDAPIRGAYNVTARASGYADLTATGVRTTGDRSCGGAGRVFTVPLQR